MSTAPREQWSSRAGFILAAVGSAVGLGNMWRFSYLAAENGGAAFLVLYLAITLLVGLPVLLAELALGRGAQASPIRALEHYGGRRWRPLGVLFVASGFLILSYYGVIAGWTVRYALGALVGGFAGDAGAYFGEVREGWDAFGFHLLFMLVTTVIVGSGVKKGIERTALVLMPTLFALIVGLAIYAATLEGAGPGYAYYLSTDFSKLFSIEVFRDAAGHAFFSLSLGMGAMMTFASYLSSEQHLPNESLSIAAADIAVAFVVGLVVFPLLFALGLQGTVAESGHSALGTLFVTLPSAFVEMGPIGRGVGVVFFLALVVGALTSAMSLLEVVVASAIDGLGVSRSQAAWLGGSAAALLGGISAYSTAALEVVDGIAGNIFLVGGALALSLFVGWRLRDPFEEVGTGAAGTGWFPLWRVALRFVVPAVLAVVLWFALVSTGSLIFGLLG